MSGLPPRPISPGALSSSRSSPLRGRRPPSPIVPQRRPQSPRIHRSRSRERATGASRYRPRSPYSRDRTYDTYVPSSDRDRTRERDWERFDRYAPPPDRWPPESERELEMERRRRERAAEDSREHRGSRYVDRYVEPDRPRWRERSISPGKCK